MENFFEKAKGFFTGKKEEGIKEPGSQPEGYNVSPEKPGQEVQKEWEQREKEDPNAHREQL